MILLKKCLNDVYANSAEILNDKSAISLAIDMFISLAIDMFISLAIDMFEK